MSCANLKCVARCVTQNYILNARAGERFILRIAIGQFSNYPYVNGNAPTYVLADHRYYPSMDKGPSAPRASHIFKME